MLLVPSLPHHRHTHHHSLLCQSAFCHSLTTSLTTCVSMPHSSICHMLVSQSVSQSVPSMSHPPVSHSVSQPGAPRRAGSPVPLFPDTRHVSLTVPLQKPLTWPSLSSPHHAACPGVPAPTAPKSSTRRRNSSAPRQDATARGTSPATTRPTARCLAAPAPTSPSTSPRTHRTPSRCGKYGYRFPLPPPTHDCGVVQLGPQPQPQLAHSPRPRPTLRPFLALCAKVTQSQTSGS
ncbi:hypothetical protein E2C01_040180 [Portunus trituberculatus]|uniref:Uncharacterized protein n=1 Tax=Portunus trituberculatus TaxID=210409 RepID=A0A5B7FFT0_PORTR|nr:hypothetical protein [Portunus trituberculatus]